MNLEQSDFINALIQSSFSINNIVYKQFLLIVIKIEFIYMLYILGYIQLPKKRASWVIPSLYPY